LRTQQDTTSLGLQSKCAAGAKTYFKEKWGSGDEKTTFLDYTNHYSNGLGKCFIRIEYHFTCCGGGESWANTITIVDAFEGTKYGLFAENHYMKFQPKFEEQDKVSACKVASTTCKSLEEFNKLSQYLSTHMANEGFHAPANRFVFCAVKFTVTRLSKTVQLSLVEARKQSDADATRMRFSVFSITSETRIHGSHNPAL